MSDTRNIEAPNEVRPFKDHGHVDVVTLGDFTLGRGVFEPGWRWSNDVELGEVRQAPARDVVDLDPGHDAGTMGDEPCVVLDTGIAAYAKAPE